MTEKKDPSPPTPQQVATALPIAQELRAGGWNFTRIADHLASEGIPTPSRWKGQPTRWTGRRVKHLLEQVGSGGPPSASVPPAHFAETADKATEEPTEEPPSIKVTGPITVTAPGIAITLTGLSGPVKVRGPFTVTGLQPAAEQEESPIIQLSRLTIQEIAATLSLLSQRPVILNPLLARSRV